MSSKPHLPAQLQPGQTLGGYEIRRLLDRGTIAEVYRAYAPELKTDIALKVLRFNPETEDRAVKTQHRFFHEIRVSASLEHPNIVRIYDFGVEGPRYYIAMQLVEGPSLRDVLSERRNGLPLEQARPLFRQVADAVAYGHSKNVIHQDIRPGNILLQNGDTPVVVDFGLMRVISDDEMTTAEFSPRAPLYMSPEQAAGGDITPRADIYSLGILLYEMVTGDVPFKGGSAARILVQHLQQSPRPPSELVVDLDMRVEVAILRALMKDPAERFSSPRAMIEAIEREINTEEFDTITLTKENTDRFRDRVQRVQASGSIPPEAVGQQVDSSRSIDRLTLIAVGTMVVLIVVIVLILLTQFSG